MVQVATVALIQPLAREFPQAEGVAKNQPNKKKGRIDQELKPRFTLLGGESTLPRFFFFFFFSVFLPFLERLLWHMEVPTLGVELEL